jgi:hypothetical protein
MALVTLIKGNRNSTNGSNVYSGICISNMGII